MSNKKEYQTLKEYSESLEDDLSDCRQANTTALLIAFLIGASIAAAVLFVWGCS